MGKAGRGATSPGAAVRAVSRRWRDYRTPTGRSPVREFIDELSDLDAEEVAAAMKDVRKNGLKAARHLRREIYEVRAEGKDESYRILFAQQGRRGQILLALVPLSKKTQTTPARFIDLAENRLRDWIERGLTLRAGRRPAGSSS